MNSLAADGISRYQPDRVCECSQYGTEWGGGGETGLRHPPQQHMQFANLLRLALKLVPVAVQPVYVADTMHS